MNTAEFVRAATIVGTGSQPVCALSLDESQLWSDVVGLAIQHRVAPLVLEGLRAAGVSVPGEGLERLEYAAWKNSATHLLLEHTLADVVAALRAVGMEVLVLKGPTLAKTLYVRPELRTYQDLDIVCRIDDYPVLHQTLETCGYISELPLEKFRAPMPGDTQEVRVFHSEAGAEIEVHCDLLQFGLRERHQEVFWESATRVDVGGVAVQMLSPTHQLVYLAAHAHRHGYSRLQWLVDLDLLIRRYGAEIDWQAATMLARDEGMGSIFRYVMALTSDLLGTQMPSLEGPTTEERILAPVYHALWPRNRVFRLERKEHRRLLHFRPELNDVREVAYGFVLLGRRQEKLRALRRYVRNQRRGSHHHSH